MRRTLICAPDHRAGWLERGAFDGTPATDRAAICAPEWPAAWNAWADRHHRTGDDRRASLGFRRAVTLDPGDGGGWFNLTQTLAADTGDAPVRFLFRAIASGRAPAAAFEHVAAVVQRQGDASGAIPLYRAALRQQPENADLHANLAAALIESGAVDAALAALETALTLDPDLARARWMRAWITLSTGDLTRGYTDFDCRWRPADASSRQHLFGVPLWDGGRLDGPLLIWGETGLGDEVLFAGLVQEAAARCGQPVIWNATRDWSPCSPGPAPMSPWSRVKHRRPRPSPRPARQRSAQACDCPCSCAGNGRISQTDGAIFGRAAAPAGGLAAASRDRRRPARRPCLA